MAANFRAFRLGKLLKTVSLKNKSTRPQEVLITITTTTIIEKQASIIPRRP
jgi:hypothetical protein